MGVSRLFLCIEDKCRGSHYRFKGKRLEAQLNENDKRPARALLQALQAVHKAGVLHGDINARNVLISPEQVNFGNHDLCASVYHLNIGYPGAPNFSCCLCC